MLKGFIMWYIKSQALWLIVMVLSGIFVGFMQIFHIFPNSFFTSPAFFFMQLGLFLGFFILIIYARYKWQHYKNEERLKKEIEVLSHTESLPQTQVPENQTTG